jgi:arginyl-tRNA synthetase
MTTVLNMVASRVAEALAEAQAGGSLPPAPVPDGVVERPQNLEHGDFATALPLKLARSMRMNPMEIAERIAARITLGNEIERVQVVPPGFINMALSPEWLRDQVETVLAAGDRHGDSTVGAGQRVQVEFVSVNPTGPIHVGHARGAVLGSVLSSVLAAAGYDVTREFYVNDAGTQMDLFYRSLLARYRQVHGHDAELPANGYVGDYVGDLAREITATEGDRFLAMSEEEAIRELGAEGLRRMIDAMRGDLEQLGVTFDVWFRESSLFRDSHYETAMRLLREGGHVVEREGATWFASAALGEDKDNVLVRWTGAPTYFASDAAYHYQKFVVAGFDRVTNIWGADHQGHVSRLKAVVSALGVDPDRLTIIISQMVSLRRGDEAVLISKRAGDLVTMRDLVEEVGPDACRYFFLSRSPDAQMEFDLELAKRESQENPVFYVQYAHARIAGILRNAAERGIDYADGDTQALTTQQEMDLIRRLLLLPELVESMALAMEPHHLPHHAAELATAFHAFYDHCRVITDDLPLTRARLKLVEAARIGLSRCLSLMGMGAPDRMRRDTPDADPLASP